MHFVQINVDSFAVSLLSDIYKFKPRYIVGLGKSMSELCCTLREVGFAVAVPLLLVLLQVDM